MATSPETTTTETRQFPSSQYVTITGIRKALWSAECIPCERTLRSWTYAGIIPSVKIGGRTYYDPLAVKLALESKRTRRAGK